MSIHIENLFARKTSMRRRGETLVKYTEASGLDDWIGIISGTIAGTDTTLYYTTQIPNVNQAESISLGNGVTSIGSSAFASAGSLKYVNIPNSVTSIGYRSFYNINSLTHITIPWSVMTIDVQAFLFCQNL